jgi:hypothetical protein
MAQIDTLQASGSEDQAIILAPIGVKLAQARV